MVVSLSELPPGILSEILSRLPIKSLFLCRSVCKAFLDLTSSNPHFNSLLSSNAAQNLAIQFEGPFTPTRLVHLVDSELDTSFPVGKKVKLKPILQIPKYPTKSFNNCRRVCVGDENKFVLVNSCNGLLFFAERGICERSFICNPITKEYVTLLEFDEYKEHHLTMGYWLGFSPEENVYKVLRTFASIKGSPWEDDFIQDYWAQVYTIGSSSWRDLEEKPLSSHISWESSSVFLNGTVCWLCRYPETSKFVVFFDFRTEKFGEIRPPLIFGSKQEMYRHSMNIGVLGGNLCVTDDSRHFDIWVMKKFGSQESWAKEFVIDTATHVGQSLNGPFRPLQILQDGKILMMWDERFLVNYDPKTNGFRLLEFNGVGSAEAVVLYTPSFVPLKDMLMVDNLMVQNMTTRGMPENTGEIEDSHFRGRSVPIWSYGLNW